MAAMRRGAIICLGVALFGAVAVSVATSKPAVNTLVFTRHDGSTFSFPHTKVSCGNSGEGGGRLAIKVHSVPAGPEQPTFSVDAILADAASHPAQKFPNDDSVFGDPNESVVFVADPSQSNEASSEQEESKGRIVFHKARCKPRPKISFTIHGKLGSEFFGVHRIAVDGFYRGRGN
jgi:hypothetical protein